MSGSLLHDGTAEDHPVENSSGTPPTAKASPGAEDAVPSLTVLGSPDAAVCVDGVCHL
ncbi:hypothetical protein [Streptomyces sp. T028]|uniref:hypothetical protein n=1 Tax=Streptomyces sp. T028 TaxID=3394379 RepID=UPI003A87F15F